MKGNATVDLSMSKNCQLLAFRIAYGPIVTKLAESLWWPIELQTFKGNEAEDMDANGQVNHQVNE